MVSSQEVQIVLDEVSYGIAGFNINLHSLLFLQMLFFVFFFISFRILMLFSSRFNIFFIFFLSDIFWFLEPLTFLLTLLCKHFSERSFQELKTLDFYSVVRIANVIIYLF